MRLYSIIRVVMNEYDILKRPAVVENVRRALSGPNGPAASSGRARLEATMLVAAHLRALAEVEATGDAALIVNDLILLEDRDEQRDHLSELLLALREYAPASDADYRVLRLAVEHLEAGIHYVLELQARTQFPRDEAPVRIIVAVRLVESRQSQRDENSRARVALQAARASSDRVTSCVRDALARAVPDAIPCERTTVAPVRIALPAAPSVAWTGGR